MIADEPRRLSRNDAKAVIRSAFPKAFVQLQDNTYNLVTEQAVGTFAQELRRDLEYRGYRYSKVWDCDDFALKGLSLAKEKHAESRRRGIVGLAESPLVGLVNFEPEGMEFHCALAFYLYVPVDRGYGPIEDDWHWHYFEPQSGRMRLFTDKERASATFFFA